ncbi:PoNi-like cognate immunity protein [Terribacillus saccharophilus]|uniref:PoNi C-terminal domain-containing protein n=1 Tax=Terribacillus saccharophilus TaxID=361277 RepID=A0A268AG76_9BACI|nr:PoNi-like cognate immunity protein [Terribacillus saccharophilus]PAD23104.1 hypothetical protein CHH64_00365 [Terribacillus saccharophilus]
MRSPLKSHKYFKNYLKEECARIDKFETVINKVIAERGANDRGVQSGLRSITGFYFNVFNALYSAGAPLEDLKKFYPRVLNSMKKVWDSESGYVEMLWMISTGIMLEVPQTELQEIDRMVNNDGIEDFLFEFLLGQNKEELETTNSPIHYRPYKKLYNVINSTTKDESLRLLRDYLANEWYQGHNDTGWYDTHKSKEDIFSGYWSFESGAIVKILELDDSSLKDTLYYPYDMVHYN